MNEVTIPKDARIVVAMSGGVDSSVAAAMLVERGYDVIGMMLRLWSEPGSEQYNRCCTPDSMALAREIAGGLNIPFYAIDAKDVFRETVVEYFIQGYKNGVTPNPCLVCNRTIRWEFLLNKAKALGADYMATGHYARLASGPDGKIQLFRAVDTWKDQSYVLHVMDQPRLQHALFPLGSYTKPQIREMAKDFKLPAANRADSQDLCFLGNDSYQDFLVRNVDGIAQPGLIENMAGELIGEHQGLPFYTIGQRRGLGIAAAEPYYVVRKDTRRNTLVVGFKDELGARSLNADQVNWISGEAPEHPIRAQVKIRYKAREVPALVTPVDGSSVSVTFDEPLRDITPGQAAVFYNGDQCLGGGIIRAEALEENNG